MSSSNGDVVTLAELVQAVQAHAIANYEQGWDVVHETMDDDELAARITSAAAATPEEAIAAFGDLVSVWLERTGPRWPDTYCPHHPGVLMHSVFPEEPPTECRSCIAEQDAQLVEDRMPLWWDDASYIRYQSFDPCYDENPDTDRPTVRLLTDHTETLCDGDRGYGRGHRCPACKNKDVEIAAAEPPF